MNLNRRDLPLDFVIFLNNEGKEDQEADRARHHETGIGRGNLVIPNNRERRAKYQQCPQKVKIERQPPKQEKSITIISLFDKYPLINNSKRKVQFEV